jgi:hypothetical protein
MMVCELCELVAVADHYDRRQAAACAEWKARKGEDSARTAMQ